jgi:transcriptional regulator with XRE-family HTH domain
MPTENLRIPQVIGFQVRHHRNASRMTQQMLADHCGLQRSYLSKIERGTSNPTIGILFTLAVALKVNVEDLCNRQALNEHCLWDRPMHRTVCGQTISQQQIYNCGDSGEHRCSLQTLRDIEKALERRWCLQR